MRGRARKLFSDFQGRAADPFAVSRVILLARIIPESLTEDLDDPALEARIEGAINKVELHR